MTLDELALDMAQSLLLNPADEIIEIWRIEDDWDYCRRPSELPLPPGAVQVHCDRMMHNDQEPTDDPVRVATCAADLEDWLRYEMAG